MMHALVLLTAMLVSRSSSISPPLPQFADQKAIDFQPVMDYDKDVCFFTAAIDKDNLTAPGSNNFTTCRQRDLLDSSNAYVRSLCNHGWCAYMYAYYADKQGKNQKAHDWQHAIAWTKNQTHYQDPNRTQQEELHSISWSNDSRYSTKPVSDDDVRLYNETHVKLDYHVDKHGNVELRLAKNNDDKIENPTGMWHQAALVNVTSNASKLLEVDFGTEGMDFKDPHFARALKQSMPDEARNDNFDFGRD